MKINILNVFLSSRFALKFNQSSGVSSLVSAAVDCSRRHIVSALPKEQRVAVRSNSWDMRKGNWGGCAIFRSFAYLTHRFFFRRSLSLITHHNLKIPQKCRLKICLTVPSALTSVPPTRELELSCVMSRVLMTRQLRWSLAKRPC